MLTERALDLNQPGRVAAQTGVVPDQHCVEIAACRDDRVQQLIQYGPSQFDVFTFHESADNSIAGGVCETLERVLMLYQSRNTLEPQGRHPQVRDGPLHLAIFGNSHVHED